MATRKTATAAAPAAETPAATPAPAKPRRAATPRQALAASAPPAAPEPAAKAPASKPRKAEKPEKADKPRKAPKVRPVLVRDGFTMPEADFALIGTLKARALAGGRETRKSELLRAGLQALAAMDSAALRAALDTLEPVKTGRPKKGR